VIKCAPEHWHGASPGSGTAYIAVTPTQTGKAFWLEPCSTGFGSEENGSMMKFGESDSGPLEVDETFVGPKPHKMYRERRLRMQTA
jgi:hypothetical protein